MVILLAYSFGIAVGLLLIIVGVTALVRSAHAKAAVLVEKESQERKAADDLRLARIKWLREQFPMGQTFDYLGRDCMPTSHAELRGNPYAGWLEHPRLFADYADDHGVIHSVEFSLAEAKAIRPSLEAAS